MSIGMMMNEVKDMVKMAIQVDALNLDKVKDVFQILKEAASDDRIPAAVREEIKDRAFSILDYDDEC